jgi:hypothetical protein
MQEEYDYSLRLYGLWLELAVNGSFCLRSMVRGELFIVDLNVGMTKEYGRIFLQELLLMLAWRL